MTLILFIPLQRPRPFETSAAFSVGAVSQHMANDGAQRIEIAHVGIARLKAYFRREQARLAERQHVVAEALKRRRHC